jgi:hypothetical protein
MQDLGQPKGEKFPAGGGSCPARLEKTGKGWILSEKGYQRKKGGTNGLMFVPGGQ